MPEEITVPADLHVEIKDKRVADGITPDGMRAYVKAHGWTLSDSGAKAEWWWHSDDEGSGLTHTLLPLRTDFIDYAHRVMDFIRCMAEVEGRSQLAVWAELRAASGKRDTALEGTGGKGDQDG